MVTKCAPLLSDLYLFSYETEIIQTLVKNIKEAKLFNFIFRNIDYVLSINNPNFSDWVLLVYPPEQYIKKTTDIAFHFQTYISNSTYTVISVPESMTNETISILTIINFPHLSSNIPTSPAYGIYISNFIRYSRACRSHSDFVKRHQCLNRKLTIKGYVKESIVLFLTNFYRKVPRPC